MDLCKSDPWISPYETLSNKQINEIQYNKKHHAHEKLYNNIKKSYTTSSSSIEYELKKSLFDPNKSSPPNEFMLKLYKRFKDHIEDEE